MSENVTQDSLENEAEDMEKEQQKHAQAETEVREREQFFENIHDVDWQYGVPI